MTDIIFHKSSKYIEDDIDYYASDTRDKHGAVKPSKNIKSYSLDSFNFDNPIGITLAILSISKTFS